MRLPIQPSAALSVPTGAPASAALTGTPGSPAPVPADSPEIRLLVGAMPSLLFAMSAACDGRRGALLVDRVMWCANEPPSIAVAVPKGHRLATLIRDSHSFALSMLTPTQRLLIKKIREFAQIERAGVAGAQTAEAFAGAGLEHDPFDTIAHQTLITGAPVLSQAVAAVDCDVMRHFDLEADHEMYVGLVVGVTVKDPGGLQRVGAPGAGFAGACGCGNGSAANGAHPAGRAHGALDQAGAGGGCA